MGEPGPEEDSADGLIVDLSLHPKKKVKKELRQESQDSRQGRERPRIEPVPSTATPIGWFSLALMAWPPSPLKPFCPVPATVLMAVVGPTAAYSAPSRAVTSLAYSADARSRR